MGCKRPEVQILSPRLVLLTPISCKSTVLPEDGFIFYMSGSPTELNELPPSPNVNKHSIVSLVLGILTVVSLCIAIFPIPGTGFICYPSSLLLGLTALVLGLVSL